MSSPCFICVLPKNQDKIQIKKIISQHLIDFFKFNLNFLCIIKQRQVYIISICASTDFFIDTPRYEWHCCWQQCFTNDL